MIKHIIFLGKYLSPQTPPIHMDLKPGKKWDCSKCSETFKTKNGLTRHMITHDPDAKVKCEVSVYIHNFKNIYKFFKSASIFPRFAVKFPKIDVP